MDERWIRHRTSATEVTYIPSLVSSVAEVARARAKAHGPVLAAVLVDLAFLAGVVVANWLIQRFVFNAFTLSGAAGVALSILEWAFAGSTVGSVLAYLIHDTLTAILRPWRSDGN